MSRQNIIKIKIKRHFHTGIDTYIVEEKMKSLLVLHMRQRRKVADAKKSGISADDLKGLNILFVDGSHLLME
jgi:hypothetical protein